MGDEDTPPSHALHVDGIQEPVGTPASQVGCGALARRQVTRQGHRRVQRLGALPRETANVEHRRRRDRARILLREMLDRPVEMRKTLRRVFRPYLSTVSQYVRTGRDAGRHYADVDAEAYILHVIQLALMATACGAVTSTVLEGDAEARYERELIRIARASLFSVP